MQYEWDELDAPLPVVRPVDAGTRAWLMDQALGAALNGDGVVQAARQRFEQAATQAAASRRILEGLDRRDVRDVRSHVVRFVREGRTPEHGSLALVGGEGSAKEPTLDVVLLEHFGRVSRVPSGSRFVARAIHDQPDVVVIHDDLADLHPVVAALLIQVCAPRSMILLVTEDDELVELAGHSGFTTCSSRITAADLEAVLGRLAA